MKLAYRQIEGFVKSPDPKARAILVYGPDNGLMRERAKIMGGTVVADINDPFNAVTLSASQLAEDPARLMDEAGAMSMMGGSRLIRIEGAGDKLTTLFKDYLKNPSSENLVILEAGELSPRSTLRKLFEKQDNAAALPCYVEDERSLAGLIRETMRQEEFAIEPDALNWLAANIGGDRRKVRSEMDKLITYMGPNNGEHKGTVSLSDVQACCGTAGVQSLEALVHGAAGAKPEAALKAYDTLLEEGVSVIAILRALQNHFRRLHATKTRMQEGQPMDQAMKNLSPPVFFKQEQAFKSHLQRWSPGALEKTLGRLTALEAQCKQTGIPVETLCGQALLSVSCSGCRN